MQPKNKIIISGGGTGGHIFPALSIANAIREKQPEAEILFVGALGRMEMEKVPAAGYKIIGLPIAGIQRRLTFKNVTLLFKLIRSLIKAGRIVRDFRPDVAVGVGGYASGPVLKAASKKGIPTVLQEQNSYAGVTNRLLAKNASKICVAYEGMEKYFPEDKILLTGNPVREAILAKDIDINEAAEAFNVPPRTPVALVVGGSLGAGSINRAIKEKLDVLSKQDFSLIWQTGKHFYQEAKETVEQGEYKNIIVREFIARMDYAYALATVVISRAGAGTISELCLVEKPVILVPSPNVAEDHQTKNAMALVQKNAALMVKDVEAGKKLGDALINLMVDEPKQEELKQNIKKMAYHNSAEKIAAEVLKIANKE
ncbi:MAG: undecaprenyldiphospho-muramoylpentapeptide beta-N-acetylglucosaminyltransferase [Bacteroidota bacterium]